MARHVLPVGYDKSQHLMEAVLLRADAGVLVGCMRAGRHAWSDDEGRSWQPLAGIPEGGPEVYQPWIHRLPDGRLACAQPTRMTDPGETRALA